MTATDRDIEKLSAWLDGELPAGEDRAVVDALKQDDTFRALDRGLRDADRAFRQAAKTELDNTASAAGMVAIRKGFAIRRRKAAWLLPPRAILPIAASLLILVGGGLWIENRLSETSAERQRETERLIEAAVQNALETAVSGSEVALGIAGDATHIRITPKRTYRSTSNHWCREFTEHIERAGGTLTRTETACRNTDGQWQRVIPGAQQRSDI